MSFMDRIHVKDCEFLKYMDNYCGEREIAIFGYGLATENMYKLLIAHGITPHHVVVNSRFLKPNMQIGDLAVEAMEDLYVSLDHKIDIIMIPQGYQESWLEPFADKINEVLFFDVTPALADTGGGVCIRPFDYWMQREEQLDDIYSRLSDELSRRSLVAYISQLIDGKYSHSDGLIKQPSYFDESFLQFDRNEVFVDCGAFNGEDTENFFQRTPVDSRAIIFEADPYNCRLVDDRLNSNPYRYSLIRKAVWNHEGTLRFSSSGKPSSQVGDSGTLVLCSSIDKTVDELKLIPTYIKMDIEGAEIKALEGAAGVIKRYKPRLAICVYHRADDLLNIWNYINSFGLDYKFYLRKHGRGHQETVLYAV